MSIAVAVSGNLVYVGVGPRLVILNIADPAHPIAIGQTSVLPDPVHSVAVAGSYAYVADGDGELRIVNVANPAAPTRECEVRKHDKVHVSCSLGDWRAGCLVGGMDAAGHRSC